MAGTLFGLPLSQPIDLNGKPQVGCTLEVYAAGGFTTRVTAYKDFGLTAGQEHPFPIPSDGYGRLPIFWLDDGNYAFRLVDKNGVVLSSSLNVQALGPSSGDGGGGDTVDPNALFQSGDVLWQDIQGTRSGFVRDNGRTVGSATSGATERANADVSVIYAFLWQNFDNTICPVTGGRGLSAAADFSANKPIQLPDKRGRGPYGLDDMGASAASRLTGLTFSYGDAITAGALGGEATHTLVTGEIPSHNHALTDPSHVHQQNTSGAAGAFTPVYQPGANGTKVPSGLDTASATTGITLANTGGGGAHNNMPPFVLGTFYRKL